MTMSTLSEEGVMSVKQAACEKLLNHRVEIKVAGEGQGVGWDGMG
jgi:nucleolar GTP-binding protein